MEFVDGTSSPVPQHLADGRAGDIGIVKGSKKKGFYWYQKPLRFANGYSMGESLRNHLESEGVELVHIDDAGVTVPLSDINDRIDPFDDRFNDRPDEPQYVVQV